MVVEEVLAAEVVVVLVPRVQMVPRILVVRLDQQALRTPVTILSLKIPNLHSYGKPLRHNQRECSTGK